MSSKFLSYGIVSVVLYVLSAVSVEAQILNAEALRLRQKGPGLIGRMKMSVNIHKSTYDIQKYGLSAHLQYRTGVHMFLFMNSFTLQTVDESRIRDKLVLHLRYNLEKWLDKRIVPEAFVQYQMNSVTGITNRSTTGAGPRIIVVKKISWNLFLGPLLMFEYEEGSVRDTATVILRTLRNSTYVSFSYKSESSLIVTSVTYFQPSLQKLSDWRLYWQIGIEIPVYKKLKLTNEFYVLYDTEPIPTYPEFQYSLNVALLLDF